MSDWARRAVLSWRLATPMDRSFCLAALEALAKFGTPQGCNPDPGAPFPSAFAGARAAQASRFEMDGRGRFIDLHGPS